MELVAIFLKQTQATEYKLVMYIIVLSFYFPFYFPKLDFDAFS